MPLARRFWGLGIVLSGVLLSVLIYLGSSVRDEAGDGVGVDTEAGRQFAQRNCARCHAVGQKGNSPIASAPPFRTFAKLWPLESIEEALAEGIVMDHPSMPEFTLTPRQINNFIAYLKTIQR